MSDDFVGGNNLKSNSADDIVAAKLKAKALEAEREAREGGGAGQSGGVDIGSVGHVGGSIAGRDLIGGNVTTGTTTTGMSAEDFNKIFDNIYKRIEALPPQVDKSDVRDAVDTIKAEAKKEAVEGGQPDEKMVKLSANSLINMAPDILEVIATTFANPAAGVATVIRKILEKAKGQATA